MNVTTPGRALAIALVCSCTTVTPTAPATGPKAEKPAPLPDPGAEWYVKYAGSLLMTVAGSIISAVTAFLIRELPNMARRTDVMDKSST